MHLARILTPQDFITPKGTNYPCSKLPQRIPHRLSHQYNPALWHKVWGDDALNLLVDFIKCILFSPVLSCSCLNPFSPLLNTMIDLSFALDTWLLSHVEIQQGESKSGPIKRMLGPKGQERHLISKQSSTCQAMWLPYALNSNQTEPLF